MVIYLNDTFIEKDFDDYDVDDFKSSLSKLVNFSDVILKKRIEFSKNKIYFKADAKIKDFFLTLDEAYFLRILTILDRLKVKFWNENSIVDPEFHYYFHDTSLVPPVSIMITDSSLAEITEVKRRGEPFTLALNLPDLRFSKIINLVATLVSKSDISKFLTYNIDCADSEETLTAWIDRCLLEKFKYTDYARTPLDEETCLINESIYSVVQGKKIQGRQVYKDKSNYYWYVDNIHKGERAEIEVFNSQGRHEGTADLRGNIDYSKRDPNKKIDLS